MLNILGDIVRPHKVYTMHDPRNEQVRYVGITVQPLEKRLSGHLKSDEEKGKKAWYTELQSLGLAPLIREVETINVPSAKSAPAYEREKYWIRHYHETGARLLNVMHVARVCNALGVSVNQVEGLNIR